MQLCSRLSFARSKARQLIVHPVQQAFIHPFQREKSGARARAAYNVPGQNSTREERPVNPDIS